MSNSNASTTEISFDLDSLISAEEQQRLQQATDSGAKVYLNVRIVGANGASQIIAMIPMNHGMFNSKLVSKPEDRHFVDNELGARAEFLSNEAAAHRQPYSTFLPADAGIQVGFYIKAPEVVIDNNHQSLPTSFMQMYGNNSK